MWQDFQNEWVQVLSVGVGHTQAEAKAWQMEYHLTYPVLADPSRTVWNKFGMGYIPHNVVIDDKMVCRFTNYGFNETQLRNLMTTYSTPLVKILHDFLPNTEDTMSDYPVDATIYSGGNLLANTIKVYWNTDGSASFNPLDMTNSGGDLYETAIPAQPTGTTVYYYIHAEADNGKMSNFPLLAPDDLAIFYVIIDTEPPVITHTPVDTWLADYWPATITAEIMDMLGLQSVTLEFNINGGTNYQVAMTNTSGDTWSGTFSGTVAQDDVVNYRIHAVDSSQAQNAAVLPTSGWFTMNISEMVDALVLDYDGNANSGPVLRDALMDLGIETHYLTALPPLPELYKSIWVCLGVAPNNQILDGADDSTLAAYLTSGHALYLEGGNFWNDDPRVELWFEFGIGTLGSGSGDAGAMEGLPGSIAEGLNFNYSGDNSGIDPLKTKTGGVAVLKNVSPEYLTTVSKNSGSYKTIGASVEFGGLVGNTSELLANYAMFFGLNPDVPPTATPSTPTPSTPTPTPTSGPCDTLGVEITMPDTHFTAGAACNTIVTVCNPNQDTYQNIPIFVILDVYGSLYFWPGFASELDYQIINVVPGESRLTILPDFTWPANTGSADNIRWYAGMTTPEMSDLFGEFGMWTFGWS